MDPILGSIVYVCWNWQMRGWLPCRGQILPISQYTALFALLGTRYGGDGITNFALPDLRPYVDGVDRYALQHNTVAINTTPDGHTVGYVADPTVVHYAPDVSNHSQRREWYDGEVVPHIAIQGIFPSRD